MSGGFSSLISTYHRVLIPLLILHLSACTTISYRQRPPRHPQNASAQTRAPRRSPLSDDDRKRLVMTAQASLGKMSLRVGKVVYRSDCSGTIRAIFAKAGIRLGGVVKDRYDSDVKAIYRYIRKYGSIASDGPRVGDLVFFHNTYDRSRNGHMNDALTHMGLVERISGTTVHFIHHMGQTIIRSRMDLSMADKTYHPKTKERINHILRRARGSRRAHTAAELFAGFGRL